MTEQFAFERVAPILPVGDLAAAWTAAGPGGHFHPPRDTSWGMREFSYVDPDGTLHRIGGVL
jgi:hypothetical protein